MKLFIMATTILVMVCVLMALSLFEWILGQGLESMADGLWLQQGALFALVFTAGVLSAVLWRGEYHD